jgi:hypothetical protein
MCIVKQTILIVKQSNANSTKSIAENPARRRRRRRSSSSSSSHLLDSYERQRPEKCPFNAAADENMDMPTDAAWHTAIQQSNTKSRRLYS